MRPLDLYSQSSNPTPEQLLTLCNMFNWEVVEKPRKAAWEPILETARRLAEQILGHYDSLQVVSDVLVGFRAKDVKLPQVVINLFLYASAQEHESMGAIINEIESLYSDETDDSLDTLVKNMWRDSMLSMMPRPSLWDKEGNIKYSPYGFSKVHPEAFRRQLNDWYYKGEVGIQALLDSYPMMSAVSRNLIDNTLCGKIYASVMPDDDPVRSLLASKLNDTEDGLQRFRELFEALDEQDNHAGFDQRLQHTYSLMNALPTSQAAEIIHTSINRCIIDWMTDGEDGYMFFKEPHLVIPNLVRILEWAKPFNFNALEEVSRNVNYMTNQSLNKAMIEALLEEGFVEDLSDLDTCAAWKQAALTATDEKFYLDLALDEKYLVMLLKFKPTSGLKEELKKTETGSESLLTQELGL